MSTRTLKELCEAEGWGFSETTKGDRVEVTFTKPGKAKQVTFGYGYEPAMQAMLPQFYEIQFEHAKKTFNRLGDSIRDAKGLADRVEAFIETDPQAAKPFLEALMHKLEDIEAQAGDL